LQRIADIYNHYLSNSIVTFEEQTVTADEIPTWLDVGYWQLDREQ